MSGEFETDLIITDNMFCLAADITEAVTMLANRGAFMPREEIRAASDEKNARSLAEALGEGAEARTREAYEKLFMMNPYTSRDVLALHRSLLDGSEGAGEFVDDERRARADAMLMWLAEEMPHPLIKACVLRREFAHGGYFARGGEAIGALWSTLVLYQWRPFLGWAPVEPRIAERPEPDPDDTVACAESFLEALRDSMAELKDTAPEESSATPSHEGAIDLSGILTEQVRKLAETLEGSEPKTLKELMAVLGLKHRPTFRDNYLVPAIRLGLIEMTIPDKPNSSLQRYRRTEKRYQSA